MLVLLLLTLALALARRCTIAGCARSNCASGWSGSNCERNLVTGQLDGCACACMRACANE